jgi:N-acetyltransferase
MDQRRILLLMTVPAFDTREGGVKVVFDVPEDVADDVVRQIAAAGFIVGRYYSSETEHRIGGSEPGWTRLGAERPMVEFTEAEQHRVVAAFDVVLQESAIRCRRIGTDVWTAGGRDTGLAGDREPAVLRPLPTAKTHDCRTLMLLIECDGGSQWLADVGFGAHRRYPLAFVPDVDQTDPGGTFKLTPAAHNDLVVSKDGEPQYRLDRHPRELSRYSRRVPRALRNRDRRGPPDPSQLGIEPAPRAFSKAACEVLWIGVACPS